MLLFSLLLAFTTEASHVFATNPTVTIYSPAESYKIPRVLYARTLLTSNKTLLATWEDYGPEPPYFPIYQSKDEGKSWHEIGRVKDEVNGWGLRYQPFLYELPVEYGGFAKGTLLLAGSSIPKDLSKTQIDLYASQDQGHTWKFVSHIARGGVAKPNNGETPVWEPFIMMHQGQLIVYYSDQRDKKHGQKLDRQSSRDLRSWGPPADDVTHSDYRDRPGMPTIAELPNGQFIMTYEVCSTRLNGCPVFYRLAADPTSFNSAIEHPLKSTNNEQPSGSPYVVWSPVGGKLGTIVVSSGGKSELYIHKGAGDPKIPWTKVNTAAPTSYTRSLLVMADSSKILVVGAGVLNGKNNKVTANLFNIPT